MAGDWIAYCKDLPSKPEILHIAQLSGRSVRETVAILLEFWAWADGQTEDGFLRHVSVTLLSQIVRDTCAVFWHAVAEVGWIILTETGDLRIANFDSWMGASGKKRLRAAQRQRKTRSSRQQTKKKSVTLLSHSQRDAQRDAQRDKSVTGSVTREEERTEENTKEKKKTPQPPEGGESSSSSSTSLSSDDLRAIQDTWNSLNSVVPLRRLVGNRWRSLWANWQDIFWRENWKRSLEILAELPFCCDNQQGWKPTFDWWLRPETVPRLLEGFYDPWRPGCNPDKERRERSARLQALRDDFDRLREFAPAKPPSSAQDATAATKSPERAEGNPEAS